MFVGGGVEHRGNRVPAHDLVNGGSVANIAHARDNPQARKALPQLEFNTEEIALGLIENHETLRREVRDLPAKFGADGTGAAGDQHRAPRQLSSDQTFVQLNRVSAEQIGNGDGSNLGAQHLAGQQFAQAGNCLTGNAGRSTVGDGLTYLASGRGGHGDDDLADIEAAHGGAFH